jgi:CheY-like chemotaxis protein
MAIKVLCAFQSEEIFEFVKSALQNFECELVKASSEALALFLTHKNFPCLIICELLSADGWGMSLLSDVKSEPDLSAIPFVFLAKRQSEMSLEPLPLPIGAQMLLTYPIESYEFAAAIKKYICEVKDERTPESPE